VTHSAATDRSTDVTDNAQLAVSIQDIKKDLTGGGGSCIRQN
jgi:hypothetical protein